jgi:hypothetical protein
VRLNTPFFQQVASVDDDNAAGTGDERRQQIIHSEISSTRFENRRRPPQTRTLLSLTRSRLAMVADHRLIVLAVFRTPLALAAGSSLCSVLFA